MRAIPGRPYRTAWFAGVLGLDGNPLRWASDRARPGSGSACSPPSWSPDRWRPSAQDIGCITPGWLRHVRRPHERSRHRPRSFNFL